MWVQSLGREDPLEEEMATHSSIVAWKIQWTEQPGGLQSMGSQITLIVNGLNAPTKRHRPQEQQLNIKQNFKSEI